MKKMWFFSNHTPLEEQIQEARSMGYELIHIKTPILQKDTDVDEEWKKLLKNLDIRPGDAFVIMGDTRWVSYPIMQRTLDLAHFDGYSWRVYFKAKNQDVFWSEIKLYTTFTQRIVEEQKQPDGAVIKKSVFKHGGFVEVL